MFGWALAVSSQNQEANLETLCTSFPNNSRCRDYLPGVPATDERGNPIAANALLDSASAGDRVLAQGLSKETYLVIETGPAIAAYGLSAVCTHLGCTVAWNSAERRFDCPCHGSRYDDLGRVIRGPAQRSLELVTVVVKRDRVRLAEVGPAVDPRFESGE